jgi:hypothetical protein
MWQEEPAKLRARVEMCGGHYWLCKESKLLLRWITARCVCSCVCVYMCSSVDRVFSCIWVRESQRLPNLCIFSQTKVWKETEVGTKGKKGTLWRVLVWKSRELDFGPDFTTSQYVCLDNSFHPFQSGINQQTCIDFLLPYSSFSIYLKQKIQVPAPTEANSVMVEISICAIYAKECS